jgi:hypothetical protein
MSSVDVLAAIASRAMRDGALGDAGSPGARSIRAAYWALDGTGPMAALYANLPRLVAQLDRRTTRRRVDAPTIRGRLDWAATIRARAESGSDASLVSRVVERSHDLLENQLLLFVVVRALEAIDRIPPRVRDGLLQEPMAGALAIGSVRERVDTLRGILRDPRLHARLAKVALPAKIDARWTSAAKASDVREYSFVVTAYDAWAKLVAAPTWDLAAPGGVVLIPTTLDTDDVWVTLAAKRTQRAFRAGGR